MIFSVLFFFFFVFFFLLFDNFIVADAVRFANATVFEGNARRRRRRKMLPKSRDER